MDNTVEILRTVLIGKRVAEFLLNRSRVLQAIKLSQECLILLNNTDPNTAQEKEVHLVENLCLYTKMTQAYYLLNDQTSEIECAKKRLDFVRRLGSRGEECTVTSQLASIYKRQEKYQKAEDLYKKSLSITIETGDRKQEALCYEGLATIYQSLGQYGKAEEYQMKALAIAKEIGDKREEARCCENLGAVYESLCEYEKAEEYLRKALAMTKETGDKHEEARCCENLGAVYESLCEYEKAEEYLRKALAMTKETGAKQREAWCYGKLGGVYYSLGEYEKAEECLRKALAITKETGTKQMEAGYYGNLGAVHSSLGEYGKAEEFLRKALAIAKETGAKKREAACYGNLGTVYQSLGENGKAEECLRKALAIAKEIGHKHGEASIYVNLGSLCRILGKHSKAKDYHEKALAMSREISDISLQAMCHLQLAHDIVYAGDGCLKHEMVSNLRASIEKCEKMRSFLGSNDQFKVSFFDLHSLPYHLLSAAFCFSGNAKEALSVLELGRARALADLISALHSAQQQTSVNPPSWADIEKIIEKECNCSCLYISYSFEYMFLWVLKGNKQVHIRKIDVNECFVTKGLKRTVHQVFSEESFREFNVLPEEQCEDRSLAFSKVSDSTCEPAEEGTLKAHRLVEEEEEENLQHLPT